MRAVNDMRSPIFYDLNNTALYTDPSSTSVLSALTLGGRSTTNAVFYAGFTLDANTMPTNSTGFTYSVNAPFTGPIMRVGDGGYDLWFNAPYGGGGRLAFRTRNGDTASINAWQYPALYNQNVNGGGDLYATIYYDQNETAYYADPNGASQFNLIYANNWFRSQNDTGWLNQTHSQRGLWAPESAGNSYGNVATYNNGRNGWQGWGIGSRHVFMSTGGDNVGVHDNSRGWIWYWDGAYTQWPHGYTFFGGSARSPLFYDNDNTAFYADLSTTGDSIRAAGNIIAYYSDDKLKTKFGNITNAVDKVCKLNGFYYEANETAQKLGYKPKREVGVSAQEVQEVLPEVVTDAPIGHGYLTVDYERIVPLLVEAIKELSAEIEMLKAR
jgi:hypothetical protein